MYEWEGRVREIVWMGNGVKFLRWERKKKERKEELVRTTVAERREG